MSAATKLLIKIEAAEYLGISPTYLSNQMKLGTGPTYLKPSPKTVLFRQQDLDDWKASWQIVRHN